MRITILLPAFILVLVGIALAQSEPEAYKFAEFGKMSNRGVNSKMNDFMIELVNNSNSQGYVISYGSPKDLSLRSTQLVAGIALLKLDSPRITFVNGRAEKTVRTVMWIVPLGAKPPAP